jgi:DNA-binding transcriptional LysR family regulator
VTLRHLRYFVAVAEELHFGRAAERLAMAQQPLSTAIRTLERDLGFDLFERYANRIRLTPAGEAFLEDVRGLLSGVDRARRTARGERGTLRIAFCSTAIDHVLPHAIASFRERFPAVGIDLSKLPQREQILLLERGELDLGFLYRPVDEREFTALDVLEERMSVVFAAESPLAAKPALQVSDLADVPLIVFSRENNESLHAFVRNSFARANVLPRIVHEVGDKDSALALVSAGAGAAILPESIARLGLPASATLRMLITEDSLRFAIVWSKKIGASVLCRQFAEATTQLSGQSPTV